MKSSFLVIAAVLAVGFVRVQPAMALTVEHDSTYAGSNGSSNFTDPDDALSGDKDSGTGHFNTMHFGSSDGSGTSFTFGVSGSNNSGQGNLQPGFATQGCLAASCLR